MTPEFAKGFVVTVGALGGMFLGFYIQDQAKISSEKRIAKRVEEGVQKRLLEKGKKEEGIMK